MRYWFVAMDNVAAHVFAGDARLRTGLSPVAAALTAGFVRAVLSGGERSPSDGIRLFP